MNCFKCGKPGHQVADCRSNNLNCFNYREHDHTNTQCDKPKKAQFGGKVFALSGVETTASDNLIKGTCIDNLTRGTCVDM